MWKIKPMCWTRSGFIPESCIVPIAHSCTCHLTRRGIGSRCCPKNASTIYQISVEHDHSLYELCRLLNGSWIMLYLIHPQFAPILAVQGMIGIAAALNLFQKLFQIR
mmetsp:Transcript_6870/g.18657  ORF Transcript_6870/g.18657 Transcript_6870/m.18657 type:complete len:107 (-) Transcript_6870:423-743(-)